LKKSVISRITFRLSLVAIMLIACPTWSAETSWIGKIILPDGSGGSASGTEPTTTRTNQQIVVPQNTGGQIVIDSGAVQLGRIGATSPSGGVFGKEAIVGNLNSLYFKHVKYAQEIYKDKWQDHLSDIQQNWSQHMGNQNPETINSVAGFNNFLSFLKASNQKEFFFTLWKIDAQLVKVHNLTQDMSGTCTMILHNLSHLFSELIFLQAPIVELNDKIALAANIYGLKLLSPYYMVELGKKLEAFNDESIKEKVEAFKGEFLLGLEGKVYSNGRCKPDDPATTHVYGGTVHQYVKSMIDLDALEFGGGMQFSAWFDWNKFRYSEEELDWIKSQVYSNSTFHMADLLGSILNHSSFKFTQNNKYTSFINFNGWSFSPFPSGYGGFGGIDTFSVHFLQP